MYKQVALQEGQQFQIGISRLTDHVFIPFDPDNTDYQQFKKDLAEGAELQDATGTPMTADQITEFLQGLA
jgi:hypothetical protein